VGDVDILTTYNCPSENETLPGYWRLTHLSKVVLKFIFLEESQLQLVMALREGIRYLR